MFLLFSLMVKLWQPPMLFLYNKKTDFFFINSVQFSLHTFICPFDESSWVVACCHLCLRALSSVLTFLSQSFEPWLITLEPRENCDTDWLMAPQDRAQSQAFHWQLSLWCMSCDVRGREQGKASKNTWLFYIGCQWRKMLLVHILL